MSPSIVSIGTTHPWNIAGLGLDARVAAEYGVRHLMAVAAVSAQDAAGLHDLAPIASASLREQLRSLPPDVGAYRIGALVSSDNVRVVAAFLAERAAGIAVVIDPVVNVTLGGELRADGALLATLREELLSLPAILTPNVPELQALTDLPIADTEQMRSAARALLARGLHAVLAKGGHLAGDPHDVLVTPSAQKTYRQPRLPGSMRGSGCTLAAAIACELALGRDVFAAVDAARAYVRAKIAARTMRDGLQVAF